MSPRLEKITLQGGEEIKFAYKSDSGITRHEVVTIRLSGDREVVIKDGYITSPLPQVGGVDGTSSEIRVKIGGPLLQGGLKNSDLAEVVGAKVTTFLGDLSYQVGSTTKQRHAPTGVAGQRLFGGQLSTVFEIELT